MEEKKLFFGGLNELRAIAALSVIFHHIELFKSRDHISSLCDSPFSHFFIITVGKNGVHLFFVLSGFLITYLLLKEKDKYQTILFKKFFLRRIFRIWPLYYLIVFIGFVIIPFLAHTFTIFEKVPFYYQLILNSNNYSFKSFLLYFLFLPNLALSYFRVPGCSQAWSVGVEEQFYILWPVLIFIFARKKIVWVFALLLSFYILIHVFINPSMFSFLPKNSSFQDLLRPRLFYLLKIIPFEYMTIGAIGGYLYTCYHDKIFVFTKSKFIYILVLITIAPLLFLPIIDNYFQNMTLGFLFLFLILITINDNNAIVLKNKPLSYLGKISYGIYMYHPFVMFLVFPFANIYFKDNDSTLNYNLFVYFFVFSITILLSHFSYKYFESVFIRIKDTKYKSL